MNLVPVVKKLVAICSLFAAFITPAIAQKNIPVDSSKLQTLRIDPGNAMGGNASDFFTEVNYIPLETTGESLFGSINRLEITDDYFIILDQNTHSILIFNKNGKYHAKIKASETEPIWEFSVNKFTKEIMYTRDAYKTYTFCDFDGKALRTVKLGGQYAKDEVGSDRFKYYFAKDKAVTYYFPNNIDSTSKDYKIYSKSLIVYSDDKNKAYAQGLPFDKKEAGTMFMTSGVGPMTASGIDTTFFYSRTYSYRIYTVTPNTIQYSYQFIFPLQMSLPLDFAMNPEYKKNNIEYIQRHPNQIYCISNVYQIADNLLFKATNEKGDNKEDNLIYNLKSGTLIAFKHILQDERSYFLPLFDDDRYDFTNTGILACKGDCLYTSASSLSMFNYHEKYADQKANYPPALVDYFKKGSKKDNPVIIQIKPKTEL